MKELIESMKRLQGDIDKYIPKLVQLHLYHDKMEKTVKELQRLRNNRFRCRIIEEV